MSDLILDQDESLVYFVNKLMAVEDYNAKKYQMTELNDEVAYVDVDDVKVDDVKDFSSSSSGSSQDNISGKENCMSIYEIMNQIHEDVGASSYDTLVCDKKEINDVSLFDKDGKQNNICLKTILKLASRYTIKEAAILLKCGSTAFRHW